MCRRKKYDLLRRAEGATVVEYAIILPVLLLILMGIIEYNSIMYAMSVLDGSVAVAARQGATGYVAAGASSRQQYIYDLVKAHSTGLLTGSSLTISSKSYASYANIGQPEPCITHSPCPGTAGVNFVDVNGNGTWDQDQGSSGVGGAGDIVVYTVTYPWPIYTPLLKPFLGNGSTFTISSSSVVKNEPYSSGVSR